MLKNVYIVAAKRTPFGAFGGALKNFTANELGGIAATAALKQLPKGVQVDSVVFGNVLQTSKDAAYLARHVGHRAGLPVSVPALTINRLCGSGFQALINGAHEILLGESEIVVTGGSESMSQSPYAVRDIRWGTRFGIDLKLEDTLSTALIDQYPSPCPMGITAENVAEKYGISREECDKYALQSQQRYAEGLAAGAFKDELISMDIPDKKKQIIKFDADEHPRAKTSLEGLTKLPAVFKKGGVVSAGNASGICDGAAAVVIASDDAVKKFGLKPLARVVSWHNVGVEPTLMGLGPVGAVTGALKKAKLSLDDMDFVELNEAFAGQFLGVARELKFNNDKTNVNGGAIAVGHPLGASGSRILAHLTYLLQRSGEKYAVGTACIGGGQGTAVILERV